MEKKKQLSGCLGHNDVDNNNNNALKTIGVGEAYNAAGKQAGRQTGEHSTQSHIIPMNRRMCHRGTLGPASQQQAKTTDRRISSVSFSTLSYYFDFVLHRRHNTTTTWNRALKMFGCLAATMESNAECQHWCVMACACVCAYEYISKGQKRK